MHQGIRTAMRIADRAVDYYLRFSGPAECTQDRATFRRWQRPMEVTGNPGPVRGPAGTLLDCGRPPVALRSRDQPSPLRSAYEHAFASELSGSILSRTVTQWIPGHMAQLKSQGASACAQYAAPGPPLVQVCLNSAMASRRAKEWPAARLTRQDRCSAPACVAPDGSAGRAESSRSKAKPARSAWRQWSFSV